MRLLLLLWSAFAFSGCLYRPPPPPGAVVSLADSHLMAHELDYGPVDRIWRPRNAPDANGRRWWQVDYRVPGDNSRIERVLVDAETGWTMFPPDGYVPMTSAVKRRGPPLFVEDAVEVAEGSAILVIRSARDGTLEAAALEARAMELNGLARNQQVVPLFATRETRDGQVALIYGWQGTRGMAPDLELEAWVRRHEPDSDPQWLDLLD